MRTFHDREKTNTIRRSAKARLVGKAEAKDCEESEEEAARKEEMNLGGTLTISNDPQVLEAFNALCAGLQSGLGKDALHPHSEILRAATDRALLTPQGALYVRWHPDLAERRAALLAGKQDR